MTDKVRISRKAITKDAKASLSATASGRAATQGGSAGERPRLSRKKVVVVKNGVAEPIAESKKTANLSLSAQTKKTDNKVVKKEGGKANNLKPVMQTDVKCLQCETVVKADLKKGLETEPENKQIADKLYWVCPTCNNNVGAFTEGERVDDSLIFYAPKGAIPTPAIQDMRNKVFLAMKELSSSNNLRLFHVIEGVAKRMKTKLPYNNFVVRIDSTEVGQEALDIINNGLEEYVAKRKGFLQMRRKAKHSKETRRLLNSIRIVARNLDIPINDIHQAIRDAGSPFNPLDIKTKQQLMDANKWLKEFYKNKKS